MSETATWFTITSKEGFFHGFKAGHQVALTFEESPLRPCVLEVFTDKGAIEVKLEDTNATATKVPAGTSEKFAGKRFYFHNSEKEIAEGRFTITLAPKPARP